MTSISSPRSLSHMLMRKRLSHECRGAQVCSRYKTARLFDPVESTAMSQGIQTRVFGPKAAQTEAAGFVLPQATVNQLIGIFQGHLSQRKTGPVQMLVELPDMPASVVNVFRYYGAAAVAHVLRSPPSGNVPALAGVFAL